MIDREIKALAIDALDEMGLTVSDAINLLMVRIARERKMPFEIKVPNRTTHKAMAELDAGKGKKFDSLDGLMADLHDEDD